MIGEIDIALGPEAPAKAVVAVGEIVRELKHIKDYATLKALTPKVREALAADADWDERVALARGLVEEAAAAEPPTANRRARPRDRRRGNRARVLKRAHVASH